MKNKQAVIGSRTISDFDFSQLKLTDVVSGGAIGIDQAVKKYCIENKIPITEIKPDYGKYGKAAPLVRNKEIVDLVDEVYAIWDGKSRGTIYTVNYAKSKGKKVNIIIKHPASTEQKEQ